MLHPLPSLRRLQVFMRLVFNLHNSELSLAVAAQSDDLLGIGDENPDYQVIVHVLNVRFHPKRSFDEVKIRKTEGQLTANSGPENSAANAGLSVSANKRQAAS